MDSPKTCTGLTSLVSAELGKSAVIDRDWINGLNASRKADREVLAMAFATIARAHGATIERFENAKKREITLHLDLNGVGCMVDIDALFGGEYSLIHWYNTKRPVRTFATKFCVCVGSNSNFRSHHKATSTPADWYSLAMMLDAGLMLAARGDAFNPIS